MSLATSPPRHSAEVGLSSCGLDGAELVDLDSLLNSCLDSSQPGALNFRLEEIWRLLPGCVLFGLMRAPWF